MRATRIPRSRSDVSRPTVRTASSIVACIAAARENASQVREEISSEMWEQLNRLFHEIAQSEVDPQDAAAVMRLVSLVREGSYSFHGATETTMSHGEGWRFVQLGKFTERACAISMLLDAYFSTTTEADDLDWVTLLASCAAFESYCRVFTADLQPDRIAKFLLVHPEFPYSVRYAVERMHASLEAIVAQSTGRKRVRVERIIGRLRASLAFTPMSELLAGDLHAFLNGVLEQCGAAPRGGPRGLHRLSDRSGVRELMFYAIRHLTRYRYNRPVWQSMHGSAHAPAQRGHAALLHVPAVGQPARAHLHVPGSPRQPGPSLRSAAAPPRADDRCRFAGQHRTAGAACRRRCRSSRGATSRG